MKSRVVTMDAVPKSTRFNKETEELRADVKKHLPALERGEAVEFTLDAEQSANAARGQLQRAAKALGVRVTITGKGPLYMVPRPNDAVGEIA